MHIHDKFEIIDENLEFLIKISTYLLYFINVS